jgi:hypothetical protein
MVLGDEILVYYAEMLHLWVIPLNASGKSLKRQAAPCIQMTQAGLL